MLTQQHLLPPLTSASKLSLFIHVHSSPFTLVVRLLWCANCSCYINNCWIFFWTDLGFKYTFYDTLSKYALCAHHQKSNHLPSPYLWSPLPFTTPHPPFPSGNHCTVVCVYEFLFDCFSCLFICFFQFYIPHISEIIWFLPFSVWFTLFSMIFSKSIHVVASDSISSFLMAE